MSKTIRNFSLPNIRNAAKTAYPIQPHSRNPLREKSQEKEGDTSFQIGQYEGNSGDMLGKGFCSKVYRGKHRKTGQQVALKVIQLQKMKSPIQKRFLNNQIVHLASLKGSKNVLQLVEIIREKNKLVIVTQLCIESLSQKLKKNLQTPQRKLGETEAIKILEDVLRGYLSMRANGLLHRDIKPANILFGASGSAVLADLGFATKDEDLQKDKYVNVGSPLYMAPEVLKGNCYSAKADIWAIGIVFLEMMIGELPWASAREQNLRDIILAVDFEKLIPYGLGSNWKDLLSCMLQTDARKRIGTAQIVKYFPWGVFQSCKISQANQDRKKYKHQQSQQQVIADNKGKITIETTITESIGNLPGQHKSTTMNLFKKSINDEKTVSLVPLNAKLLRHSTPDSITNRSLKPLLSKRSSLARLQPKKEEVPLMELKLRLDDEFKQFRKEQLSQLHLCRFIFKVIQLLVSGKDNIHFTYLNRSIALEHVLGEFIIQILDEVREIKSEYPKEDIKRFRKGKDYRNILKVVEKYEANYRQYFSIKLNRTVEASSSTIEQILSKIDQYLSSGGQHLKLIDEQMEKSDLHEVWDQQICQFSILIDYLASLKHLLKLKQRGTVLFARMSKIQEISATSNATKLRMSHIHKICRKIA